MAHVHLVSLEPESAAPGIAFRLRESAAQDRFGVHALTDDPGGADIILFTRALCFGMIFRQLLGHPLVRKYRRKCFLYDPNDRIVPLLPGIYPSLENKWNYAMRTRSGAYLTVEENPFLDEDHHADERRYLYSFVGTYRSAVVRENLGRLDHPRGHCRDTYLSGEQVWRHGSVKDKREFRRQYLATTWMSSFVLCPRGFGTGSIRLFETMRAGRAPVILADDWVPPEGPDWGRFSLRVAEADWHSLPRVLEGREAEAAAMGRVARKQWEEWFAPTVLFHRMIEDCLEIDRARMRSWPGEPVASWLAYTQMLRPSHLRHWARQMGWGQKVKNALRFRRRG